MNNTIMNNALHISANEMLERSRWYGLNLVTILTYASETDGAFSLVKNVMRKGSEPPLHVHTKEDESNFILKGEILFTIGDKTVHARTGDYIHLPKNVPHTFKILGDTAETLLLITPGGFEEMFIECSRPALSLELPPHNAKPPKEFFEKIKNVSETLGAIILPSL